MKTKRVETFDDWKDVFRQWQAKAKEIKVKVE